MGQSISNHFDEIKDDVAKEAQVLKEVINITHEEFLGKIKELNKICKESIECESRKLHFAIKRRSDATFLWKQTVRIACMRVKMLDESAPCFSDEYFDEEHFSDVLATTQSEVEVYKLLNIRQFLIACKTIMYHFSCFDRNAVQASEAVDAEYLQVKAVDSSMLLEKIMNDSKADTEECIICMERSPEITLPCAHAYCLFCIEQWNVSNKTCPVCRAAVENTDDSWVTPQKPESSEINAEIQKALTVITSKLPEE